MAKPIPKLLFFLLSFSSFTLFLFVLSRTSPRSFFSFYRFADLENTSPSPPRIAYFITGSNGDGPRIVRLLHAIYHPKNQYLLHLDRRASQKQREELAILIQSVETFVIADNVNVVGKADYVNYGGSTPIASLLHGAAILMRYSKDWDWFVNLMASDYPLVTQDDFLHVLSFVPKNFNFIEHTSNISWREYQRSLRIIVDPGLYRASSDEIIRGNKNRTLPNAFKIFTGSPSVILSRKFVEFFILGWDNLPRTLLMYFSNTRSSHKGYLQTLACNTKDFSNTVINSNLRFIAWDNPPREEPRNLTMSDVEMMLRSGAPFAGSLIPNDPLMDAIDSVVLQRSQGRIVPGGWCLGRPGRGRDPCQLQGDAAILRPGSPTLLRPGSAGKRFEKHLLGLMANLSFWSNQCTFQ